jgi:hypothetical protein
MKSERRVPTSVSFVIGAVLGAAAVLVPMTSAGHSVPKPGATAPRPVVGETSPNLEAADSKTTCDNDRCDVQLD